MEIKLINLENMEIEKIHVDEFLKNIGKIHAHYYHVVAYDKSFKNFKILYHQSFYKENYKSISPKYGYIISKNSWDWLCKNRTDFILGSFKSLAEEIRFLEGINEKERK